jgi:hypothetical protein
LVPSAAQKTGDLESEGASQVAEEIWVCDKGTVKPWKKDIRAYKAKLAKSMKM